MNGLTNVALATGHYERLAYVGLEANSQGCRDMGLLPRNRFHLAVPIWMTKGQVNAYKHCGVAR